MDIRTARRALKHYFEIEALVTSGRASDGLLDLYLDLKRALESLSPQLRDIALRYARGEHVCDGASEALLMRAVRAVARMLEGWDGPPPSGPSPAALFDF